MYNKYTVYILINVLCLCVCVCIFTISQIDEKSSLLVVVFSSFFFLSLVIGGAFVIYCERILIFVEFLRFYSVTFTLDFSLSILLIEPIFTVIILSNLQYTLDYDYFYGSHAMYGVF